VPERQGIAVVGEDVGADQFGYRLEQRSGGSSHHGGHHAEREPAAKGRPHRRDTAGEGGHAVQAPLHAVAHARGQAGSDRGRTAVTHIEHALFAQADQQLGEPERYAARARGYPKERLVRLGPREIPDNLGDCRLVERREPQTQRSRRFQAPEGFTDLGRDLGRTPRD
jgi:hypothetical protein